MKITLVKKILADGRPCPKCAEVEAKMRQAGYLSFIDETLIADERDASSPGMRLAAQFAVDRAPFFLVEEADKEPRIYTVYLKFVKEVLKQPADDNEEIRDLMESNPDLDFL